MAWPAKGLDLVEPSASAPPVSAFGRPGRAVCCRLQLMVIAYRLIDFVQSVRIFLYRFLILLLDI